MRTVYVVLCNADTTEGRGSMVATAIFESEGEAKKLADRLEPYKNSGQFNKVEALPLLESMDDYFVARKEGIRKQVIKRLYQEEKEVLGIED
jgi:hypothetical protein